MSKKDWEFEDLLIPQQTIGATFAYWMVRQFNGAPSDFAQGFEEFQDRLADQLAWADLPGRHFRCHSQGHLDMALYRALSRCPVVQAWLTNQQVLIHTAAHAIAEMLWKDACASERIRRGEAERSWWERLFDWLH